MCSSGVANFLTPFVCKWVRRAWISTRDALGGCGQRIQLARRRAALRVGCGSRVGGWLLLGAARANVAARASREQLPPSRKARNALSRTRTRPLLQPCLSRPRESSAAYLSQLARRVELIADGHQPRARSSVPQSSSPLMPFVSMAASSPRSKSACSADRISHLYRSSGPRSGCFS